MRQLQFIVLVAFTVINLSAVVFSAGGIEEQYDEPEEKPATHTPKFLSKPQTLYAEVGQSVTMFCDVERLDPYTRMWMKGEGNILFLGNTATVQDSHYAFNQSAFTIHDLQKHYEGQYTCELSTEPRMKLINTVRIKTPPKVHANHNKEKEIEVKEGEVLSLTCKAEGQPPPKMMWLNEDVPLRPTSGVLQDNNETLTFSDIRGSDAGQFECVAENGVGHKAKHVFVVKVKHAPNVKIEKNFFQTGDSVKLDIVCSARADPPAQIHWSKNGQSITESDRVQIHTKDNHSTVRILNVKDNDFGVYRCEAKNTMGINKGEIDVSGAPNQMTFVSNPDGDTEDSYILDYLTQTMSPIIDFDLKIRKAMSRKAENKEPWTQVVIPGVSQSSPRYRDKYVISGLQPATAYELHMTARNKYGTSAQSELFRFTTLGGSLGDQRASETQGSAATPESVKELKSSPSEGNGSPRFEQRAKIVAIMTVIILIAFF